MNNKTISFFIPGQPLTKENKGQFGSKGYYAKTHAKIKHWEEEVADIAKKEMIKNGWHGPWKGRVGIMANMCYADYGRKDITNYWKSLNDALNGVVYIDDAQIDFAACCRQKEKLNPGIYVEIYFFDYMYDTKPSKRPDPYKTFDIANIEFDHGLLVHQKQTRSLADFVGVFEKKNSDEQVKDSVKYVNNSKARKRKNGKRRTTRA